MSARTYWLDLFSGQTWDEFLRAGATVSGFSERRWKTVQQIRPGDYLLCYLTGISRWIGALEVISEPYRDETPIWKDAVFPCRVKVKIVVALTPETAIPITDLRDHLSIFQRLSSPTAWSGHVRMSPARWETSDGEAVIAALLEAKSNPVTRPFDPARLERRHQLLRARMGLVTVPEREEVSLAPSEDVREQSAHDEIQWLLLKFGNDMGLDVWVARNDRGRVVDGHRFTDLPRLRKELPHQFDEATSRTIELIDVLWLQGNAIVAAFEIESTTSIYSGLLRMSDLIAMQPNLNIPLYLVAPDERREKVFAEVNRPTFSRLNPPMNQICHYMPFSVLRERIPQLASVARFLKPGVLEDWSEDLAQV